RLSDDGTDASQEFLANLPSQVRKKTQRNKKRAQRRNNNNPPNRPGGRPPSRKWTKHNFTPVLSWSSRNIFSFSSQCTSPSHKSFVRVMLLRPNIALLDPAAQSSAQK
ncbi:hypothetical protein TcG_12813, partial [Trypanosoma cruzi]